VKDHGTQLAAAQATAAWGRERNGIWKLDMGDGTGRGKLQAGALGGFDFAL
jgi:hypothetical protein